MRDNDFEQLNALREEGAKQSPLSPEAEAWGNKRAFEVLSEKVARYEAALTDIANADGDECHVMSSLRYIEGYHEGVKTQAQRARAGLGNAAPPMYPPSVLLARIGALETKLKALGGDVS